MKVFVAGATGVLGRATVPRLVAAGHEVWGTARSLEKADQLRAQGAAPVTVDLFDPVSVLLRGRQRRVDRRGLADRAASVQRRLARRRGHHPRVHR